MHRALEDARNVRSEGNVTLFFQRRGGGGGGHPWGGGMGTALKNTVVNILKRVKENRSLRHRPHSCPWGGGG
jgi:hypothetical protein